MQTNQTLQGGKGGGHVGQVGVLVEQLHLCVSLKLRHLVGAYAHLRDGLVGKGEHLIVDHLEQGIVLHGDDFGVNLAHVDGLLGIGAPPQGTRADDVGDDGGRYETPVVSDEGQAVDVLAVHQEEAVVLVVPLRPPFMVREDAPSCFLMYWGTDSGYSSTNRSVSSSQSKAR